MKHWMFGLGALLVSGFAQAEAPAKAADSPHAAHEGDLAAQYEKEAEEARADAEKHRKMADDFKKQGGPQITKWKFDVHCKNLSKYYEKIGKEKAAMSEALRKAANSK